MPSSTPGWASRLGTTAWPLMATMPLVTVQTWRSCTADTPGTASIRACTSASETWRGTDSSRMSVLSPDQPPGAGQNEQGDEDGDRGVGHGPPGERYDSCGRQRADR